MWLPDTTVGYLNGKHITLFVLAVVIFLAGVAYTTLTVLLAVAGSMSTQKILQVG